MDFDKAQKKVKTVFKNIEHPRLASFIALTEEIGEVANEIMKKEIYEEKTDIKDLKNEIGDVLICLLELANVYDVNLNELFSEKMESLEPRVKEWNKLKDILSKKRDKLN